MALADPGAVIATLLWMGTSFGFSLYVAYISNYSATYGSLSAAVVNSPARRNAD